jgi:hypothetical protein
MIFENFKKGGACYLGLHASHKTLITQVNLVLQRIAPELCGLPLVPPGLTACNHSITVYS